MKKILLNSEWYFKYKTIGNKAADIPGQMITLPHDAMIGLDCSEDGDRKKGFYPNVHLLYSKEIYIQSEWKGCLLYTSPKEAKCENSFLEKGEQWHIQGKIRKAGY